MCVANYWTVGAKQTIEKFGVNMLLESYWTVSVFHSYLTVGRNQTIRQLIHIKIFDNRCVSNYFRFCGS